MGWQWWLGIIALVVSAIALGVVVGMTAQNRRLRQVTVPVAVTPRDGEKHDLIAFVANPSKPDVAALRDTVRRTFADAALPEPLWLETTIEDPGVGQTREALARGADVVVAVGGDGTVRAVAEGMVGTAHPMGLIPLGTGNLLARNLDLPLGDAESALRIVIAGSDRRIDVGRVRIGADSEVAHLFLVIAGLGFDAAMVADADDTLKARVGWVAYFVAGIRHLHGRRMRARITIDDGVPASAHLRSVMIGNCGRLPGGITLLPDAEIDDGILDIAAVDTRGGLVGWAQLFGEVVMQGFGLRNDLPAKVGRIDHTRATRVRVVVEAGAQAQVDGEVLGPAPSHISKGWAAYIRSQVLCRRMERTLPPHVR